MAKDDPLSAAQRGKIRRLSSSAAGGGDDKHEEGGEINVVPFLDIITNVLMFVLATVAVTFTATIDSTPPMRGLRPPTTQPLDFTVLVVNEGFSLKTHGGNVATGCSEAGTGVAIPKTKDGAYDYEALRACASKLKSSTTGTRGTSGTTGTTGVTDSKSEQMVTVSANPSVPYQVVINTVDAVRKSESGDDLFPDVSFAVAR